MLHRLCSNVQFVYTNTIHFENGFVRKDPRFRKYDIHLFSFKREEASQLAMYKRLRLIGSGNKKVAP